MRVLPGFSLPLLLALLIIGTTPTGTGVGLHQFDLIHPLYAHVHIVNGQVLSHDRVPTSPGNDATNALAGPALGAGSGANQSALGSGISPVIPMLSVCLGSGVRSPRPALTIQPLAGCLQDAPPDPPPTSAA
jgi:hypothetical protein